MTAQKEEKKEETEEKEEEKKKENCRRRGRCYGGLHIRGPRGPKNVPVYLQKGPNGWARGANPFVISFFRDDFPHLTN